MKKIILLLFFVAFLSTYSQSVIKDNKVIITVKDFHPLYKDAAVGNSIIRDYYQYTDETKDGEFKLPSKDIYIAIPPFSVPHITVLNFIKSQNRGIIPQINSPILSSDISQINESLIPDKRVFNNSIRELVELKECFWMRDFYCAHLKINTHQFDISSNSLLEYKDIKFQLSFDENYLIKDYSPINIKSQFDSETKLLLYNSQIAEQFRYTKNIKSSNTTWFDNNSIYLKFGTGQDGIFRLYRNDLEKYGINAQGIDPRTIKIYKKGKEIPIFINGEGDGKFDQNDYIEFYGENNYSKIPGRVINPSGSPYNNYLDKYTDTSFYFLTWGKTNGQRIPVVYDYNSNISDTLNYYTLFDHIEKNLLYQSINTTQQNQNPEWLETEAWYWNWLWVGSFTFNFNVTDLILNKNAAIYFKAVGYASNVDKNSHSLSLKIGTTTIDSQSIGRNDRMLLGKNFNSSLIKNGNNSFTITNHANGTNPNTLLYDWYEIEYPRKLKANNDSLTFEIRDSISNALRIIKVDNVTTDSITIYKYRPYLRKISNFKLVNSSVLFSDTVGTGAAYILIKTNKALTPKIYYRKQFLSLSDSSKRADYIAITHPILQKTAYEYVNFIANQYKVATQLVLVDDIYDEFAFGYPEPECIKEFLKTAFNNWGYPKPSYLCLIGSATYDYKSYFLRNNGYEINKNLVPSFGEPVSDSWFGIWDNSFIPQICIGRIPANSPDELSRYFEKHKSYLTQGYDIFNKSGLFFSGGDGNDEAQMQSFKSINDRIIAESVKPRPNAFSYSHFYKTAHPTTDFGPYDYKFIDNKIKEGSLFVSYIGHSGTRTWDNSITEPYQLTNVKNKNYLVTDFGCSTAKFAEPDVACFGSLFLFSGQAIVYIGNSSLGFTNTAAIAPNLFYHSIFVDSLYNLGRAHINAKINVFNQMGYSDFTRIFALTNSLMGDPIINLAVPRKPNLKINEGDLEIHNKYPTDRDDSVKIVLKINNLGMAPVDSFSVIISDTYANNIVYSKKIRRILPALCDTLVISIPINKKIGLHRIDIVLDPENAINELYENDNNAQISFNVSSVSIRPYAFTDLCNSFNDFIRFINPVSSFNKEKHKFIVQVDTSVSFSSGQLSYCDPDSFVTDYKVSSLINNQRYWLRTKLDIPNSEWNKEISFIKSINDTKIVLKDNYGFSLQNLKGLSVKNNNLLLSTDTVHLQVRSGGGNVSKYGSINKNGINVLPNTFNWGMGIAVFNEKTLDVDTARTFWFGDNIKEVDNLVNLINSIPQGKIVLMNVIDDGSSNLTATLKNAIKTLGSTKVDSIKFRSPWVLIGLKGAKPGSVIEIVKDNTFPNILDADTSFIVNRSSGELITNQFGPSSGWKTLSISQKSVSDNSIINLLLGVNNIGKVDTLKNIKINNGVTDISSINAKEYPYLLLSSTLKRENDQSSPSISLIDFNFVGIPELGTNNSLVSISKDTVQIGEGIRLNFDIFNIGEASADSFKVKVEVVKPDNSHELIYEEFVKALGKDKKKNYSLTYNTSQSSGSRNFLITIDAENKVNELYKDNNYFSVPFYIKPDTTRPTLKVSFDGRDIFDGEYVSSRPDIKVELSDKSFLPITDTTAIKMFLNDRPITYSSSKDLKITYNPSNPKVLLNYNPLLENGEYTLRIIGKNASGNFADSTGITRTFQVSNEIKLIDLYNYPNPFTSDTYFTFKLTQIPDELKIKIYTVAGRMVKEIVENSSDLRFDFNKIYWDGRDQDGDLLANGVYLYKILMTKDGKTNNYLQKIAIVR